MKTIDQGKPSHHLNLETLTRTIKGGSSNFYGANYRWVTMNKKARKSSFSVLEI